MTKEAKNDKKESKNKEDKANKEDKEDKTDKVDKKDSKDNKNNKSKASERTIWDSAKSRSLQEKQSGEKSKPALVQGQLGGRFGKLKIYLQVVSFVGERRGAAGAGIYCVRGPTAVHVALPSDELSNSVC